jgi:hypothetical protein
MLKFAGAHGILLCVAIMLTAVEFHDQTRGMAIEIRDILSDRRLSTEMETIKLFSPQRDHSRCSASVMFMRKRRAIREVMVSYHR